MWNGVDLDKWAEHQKQLCVEVELVGDSVVTWGMLTDAIHIATRP